MSRKYGWVDRAVAMMAALTMVAAGCGGGGGGESDPVDGPGPAPGAAGFDTAPGGSSNLAGEVASRRALPNALSASTEVGTMPGRATVDARGSAHYAFPISVAPGPGGMQPEISISYDSSRDVGYAGLGFAIDGFGSTIERCEKTLAEDGYVDRIRLNEFDALCFGGRRMVLVAGTAGEAGAEYRTRRDPFDRIILQDDTIGHQDSRWEVWLNDGRVIEYSSGLKISASEVMAPLKWYAERIRDRYDNSLEYGWSSDDTSIRPDSITYGDGRSVEFEFIDLRNPPAGHSADEVSSGYVAGRLYEKPYLLEQIRVYGGGGAHLWDYEFEYDLDPGMTVSKLQSVQQCDAAGACVPATTFEWSPEEVDVGLDAPFVENSVTAPAAVRAGLAYGAARVADIDGNGVDEVITTGFDSEFDYLLGRVEGIPEDWGSSNFYDPNATNPAYWDTPITVDPLNPAGFPAGEDPDLHDVVIPGRHAVEEFTRNLQRAELFLAPGDPTWWTFNERDEVAATVANGPYPDAGDSQFSAYYDPLLEANSLGPLDIPAWIWATPPLGPVSANLFGDGSDALVYPISPSVLGGADLPAAEWLAIAHGAEWNHSQERVDFRNYPLDPGGRVHSLLPVDHDGNGLTDFWMCRGADALDSTWVLALNDGENADFGIGGAGTSGSAVPPNAGVSPAVAFHDTGVRCSAFDETLIVPRDGTGHSSLFVSPAFDPYSPSQTPLADADRQHYYSLDYVAGNASGSYQLTSLPRDRFQRWHDQNCRNVAIGAGFPVFGAGPGSDRIIDVNGDGFGDVVRFELVSGDGPANLGNIQEGLASSWNYRDSCVEDPAHQDAAVRVYLNHGDGAFEAQPAPLFNFSGIPHASYWLNWMGGEVLDVNADTRTDFFLPFDTDGDPTQDTFTFFYTRPSGSLGQAPATAESWIRYDSDSTWKENFRRLGSIRLVRANSTGRFLLVGDRDASQPGIQAVVDSYYRLGRWPRVSVVEDGLGARQTFGYGQYSRSDGFAELPASRMTAPKTVVSSLRESTGPDGSKTTVYQFTNPVRDLRSGRVLGFERSRSEVYYGLYVEGSSTPVSTETRDFDFSYDPAIADYPHAAVPEHTTRAVWVDDGSGVEQLKLSCDTVESWRVHTPDGGATWFSYPEETRSVSAVGAEEALFSEEAGCTGLFDSLIVSDVERSELRNDAGQPVHIVETVPHISETTTTFSDELTSAGTIEHWFRGKMQRGEVTSCGQGISLAECETRTEELVYDPEHAEVDQMILEPGVAAFELTTDFVRNGHGRVTTKTRTDTNGAQRVERFGWDTNGVHLEWSDNAVGHRSYLIHDGPTGALVAQIEPNGNSAETVYDGFLRPTRTQRRVSPMGAFSPAWSETEYAGPAGSDTFALRTTNRTMPAGQVRLTELDPHGHKLREQWEGVVALDQAAFPAAGVAGPVNHNQVEVFYEYDERGRNIRESKPTWVGEAPPSWREWTYDNLNRKRNSVLLDAGLTSIVETEEVWTYDYGGSNNAGEDFSAELVETYTDQDSKTTVRNYDRAGRVSAAFDGRGVPTAFVHGAFGQVRHVHRGGLDSGSALSTTTYTFDRLGRRASEVAPENGTTTVSYTPFGETEVVVQPEGTSYFVHDDLGRTTDRIDDDGTTDWAWDTVRLGALGSSASADGIGRSYGYDEWGRVDSETTTAALGAYTLEYGYDEFDRLTQVTYPEPGYAVFHEYDVFGYHRRSRSQRAPCSVSDAAIDWEWVEGDPAGNVTVERMGNGAETTRGYQLGTYRPEAIQTVGPLGGSIQSLDYVWSDAGDLDLRNDYNVGQTEDFTYDDAHRLRTWSWGGTTWETKFDDLGNITDKSGQGSYMYDGATDRLMQVGSQVYSYDGNGNVRSDGERTLTWTAQNLVRSLQRGGQSWSVLYDAEGTRVVREEASANEAAYSVSPTYELRFDGASLAEARISVLGATGRVVAEVFAERTELAANDLWEHSKKFVHDDHLGSTHAVTDRDAAVESRVMYGPWGTARDGDLWNLPLSEAALDELPAGFTGHQPELDAGLINMRGRMYDPAVGRFMSVDPVIENALEVGTWNAYSYVQNRPLSLVDPTGMASEEPVEEPEAEVAAADDASDASETTALDVFVDWLIGLIAATQPTIGAPEVEVVSKETEGERVDETKGWAYWGAKQGLAVAWAVFDMTIGFAVEASGEGAEVVEARDSGTYTAVMLVAILAPFAKKFSFKTTPGVKGPCASKPVAGKGCGDASAGGGGTARAGYNGVEGSVQEVWRTTRNGTKAVRQTFPDGSVKDISTTRVKEFVPNQHPKAPPGTLQKVKFDNALAGSKGYKRPPTAAELAEVK